MTTPASAEPALNHRHSNSVTARVNQILWLCVFVMFGLVVMSRSKADPDLWGHVTYGKEVLRDGHLHDTTTWSYAVDDFRWINHENIAELLMAAADQFGGQTGLLLLKSLLTLVVLGLPIRTARQNGAGLATCGILVVMLSFNISFHWLVRPHMLSYACGAGLLAILATHLPGAVTARERRTYFSKWLWLIPPLMCFWTNSHGGYLAGLAILTAWLGLDGIELLLDHIRNKRHQSETHDERLWSTVKHHALLFAATVAACMVNPYGYELHTWMLSSLGRPRPEISEWAPLPLFSIDGMPFWCLVLGAFLCLKRSAKSKRWPGLIVMALLCWQAVKHHRHLPFVAMMAAFVLAPHIESVMRQLKTFFENRVAEHQKTPPKRSQFGSLVAAVCLLLILTACQFPRQATLHVDRNYYPVSAMQYMANHQLRGKVFVTFNWAQYALAVFSDSSPHSRIAFDGRFRTCYPQSVIDMYFDFILGDLPKSIRYREDTSGPFDPEQALSYRSPDLVLFERDRKNAVATMESVSDEWCLLYQDSLAQLWGRRSVYDDPASGRYLPVTQRSVTNEQQQGTVAWPAFPRIQRHQTASGRRLQTAAASL